MILDRSPMTAATGWTKVESTGTDTFNVTQDGTTGLDVNNTSTAWNSLGVIRTSAITGAAGHVMYLDVLDSGNSRDFQCMMANSNTMSITHHYRLYFHTGHGIGFRGAGVLYQENNTNDHFPGANWISFRWVIDSGGNFACGYAAQGDYAGTWYDMGTGDKNDDFNAIGANLRLQINQFQGPTSPVSAHQFYANYFYTDDGNLNPPAPSGLTATTESPSSLQIDWTVEGTATNTDVVAIFMDSGSGYVEIATVALGVKTYLKTGLSANTVYSFKIKNRVTVTGTNWDSAASSSASATTDPPPGGGSDGSAENLILCIGAD